MVKVSRDGLVARIALDRPERRNALSRGLVRALGQAVAAAAADDGVRVVVLAGEGAAFCAGGDIAEFAASSADGSAESDATGLADLLATMAACPKPVVARVHGAAFGGGVGLICAADIAVAGSGTRFALSEARLGLVPAVISPFVLRALGEREGLARMLLAEPFGAEAALRIGLVHRVVPDEELDRATDDICGALLRNAPGALAAIKGLPAVASGDVGRARAATIALLVERLGSAEGQEGLRAFIEKRSPAWVAER